MAARIAVIAVHGVADQSPGSTARSVVDLLIASAPAGARYQAIESESFTLAVAPLPPENVRMADADATPLGEDRSASKSFLQSARSDFQRQDWTAPTTRQAWSAQGQAEVASDSDRGIAFSDYLLGKNLRNGAERESHESTRIGMRRRDAAGVETQVEVFELYWADLSRLSGAMPRIVTEIFTMIFRLSKLGRDTVDEAHRAFKAVAQHDRQQPGVPTCQFCWSCASWLQIAIDWFFANGLALLFLQLALLAAMLLGLGLLSALDPLVLAHVDRIAAGLLAIAGLLVLAYRYREWRLRPLLAPLAMLVAGGLALFVWPILGPWLGFALLLGAVTLASETGLRIADDRFPLVRRIGRLMWTVIALLVVASAARQTLTGEGLDIAVLARAALFGVEVALLAIMLLWMLLGVLLPIWLIAGWFAAHRGGYEAKASIATGRLGLGLSIGAFLALTMTIWTLLSGAFESAVHGVEYAPCIFHDPDAILPPASVVAAQACLWAAAAPGSLAAQEFLHQRFVGTTSSFALVAVVLLLMALFLVSMFLPSVLAEMKLLVRRARNAFRDDVAATRSSRSTRRLSNAHASDDTRARRLGRWLTSGYRSLDGVAHLLFGAGVVLGFAVALALADVPYIERLTPVLKNLSQGMLKPLVITAASISAILVIFGGLLSKYLPGIRGPLDIALDVDNHFREFPRMSIPRARIFSRYVALLRHLNGRGYDRIVVVAHSQGSVISAELLRYLSSDGVHAPAPGRRPRVDGKALPPIQLLTVGCPLRQLYAARFPTLYRWVLARRGAVSGPLADDIGVERWINAYCSGDYVGRWLWSDEPDADQDPLAHPMVESVGRVFGRIDTYAGFDPMPPDAATFGAAREVELCLGLGAHTHYFEPDQTTVAWLIDGLITRQPRP